MSKPLPPLTLLPALRRATMVVAFACLLLVAFTGHAEAAEISGRITDTSGEPLDHAYIDLKVFSPKENLWVSADYWTNSWPDGSYSILGIPPGTYRMEVSLLYGYRTEYYNNQTQIEDAEDIVIVTGQEKFTGYDVALARDGIIRGRVLDPLGQPIPDVTVSLYREDGSLEYNLGSAFTDHKGEFGIGVMTDEPVRVLFRSYGNTHLAEYYNDKPDLASADPITVLPDEVRTISVTLSPGKTIYGNVRDSRGNYVYADVRLYRMQDDGTWPTKPYLDMAPSGTGKYAFPYLEPAKYRLEFFGYTTITEYYDNQSTFADAAILDLTGPVESIEANAVLAAHGSIAGTVTDLQGAPVQNIEVIFYYEKDGEWIAQADRRTDGQGRYVFEQPFPDRTYRLRFYGLTYHASDPYAEEWFQDVPTAQTARIFTVPLGRNITNINAVLRREREVEANFTVVPYQGVFPLTVTFENRSLGDVSGYQWDFGDDTTSTAEAPTHTYTQPGLYSVTLTAMGAENQHTKRATYQVRVLDPASPGVNLLVPLIAAQ